jgi:hypothetical protein
MQWTNMNNYKKSNNDERKVPKKENDPDYIKYINSFYWKDK